jgi:hypothetical protein
MFKKKGIHYCVTYQCLRYQSKFKDTVKVEVKKNKQDHRTMGFAKEPVPKPNEYLKAHEKEYKLPESNYHSFSLT